MPRCIHAAPRRAKNPTGLPEAARIAAEQAAHRREVDLAYGEYLMACNDAGLLAQPLPKGDPLYVSVDSIRASTARARAVAKRRSPYPPLREWRA